MQSLSIAVSSPELWQYIAAKVLSGNGVCYESPGDGGLLDHPG